MDSQTLQPNATLQGGKYIIKKVLGQGGFGITYLAEHRILGIKVAIKEFFMKGFCIRNDKTSWMSMTLDAGQEQVSYYQKKFIKEARNIASLTHPNIIRIHDIFEENGTSYYVMDYCENGSLSELLKLYPSGIGEAKARKYIRQIAAALQCIHEQKMNHLDVKPANVLLDKENNAILIDFGISKNYGEDSDTTIRVAGVSHGYAPIEQYTGLPNFSPQTDIYSLGATLYKLITGFAPPEAQIIEEEGLPDFQATSSIKDAIAAAMQFNRKKRPHNIDAWLRILDGQALFEEIERHKTEEDERRRKKYEKKRRLQEAEEKERKQVIASYMIGILLFCTVMFFILKPTGILDPYLSYFKERPIEERNKRVLDPSEDSIFKIAVDKTKHKVKQSAIYYLDGRIAYYWTGMMENGLPEGKGQIVYPNGDLERRHYYEGHVERGLRVDSMATLVFLNGAKYSGSFVDDQLGVGNYSFKKGEGYYKGSFIGDTPYDGKWYYNGTDIVYEEVVDGETRFPGPEIVK